MEYEFLIFAEKDEYNISCRIDRNPEIWDKVEENFLSKLKKWSLNLKKVDRSGRKREFFEYCKFEGTEYSFIISLLPSKLMKIDDFYNRWLESYDKNKYIAFEDSFKREIDYKGIKLILGSKKWFKEYVLAYLEKEGKIQIDYLTETIQVMSPPV